MEIFNGSKKLVSISLFIFWAAVTAIIAVGFLFYQKRPIRPDSISLLPIGGGSIVLNAQEIGKHNSPSDCWMIIDNKVYNITSYLGVHPGGVGEIVPYCGRDGTQAFANLPHSSNAASILSGYFIGNLNQTASAQAVQQNIQNTNNLPAPTSRRGRDDGEYDD